VWGLWRRDLEPQLCWGLAKEREGSYAGPLESRAPSWSWASVNGPLQFSIELGWKVSDSPLSMKLLIRIVHIATAPIRDFPLEGNESKKMRLICGPPVSARETRVNISRDHEVVLAGSLIRVAWISYWDVPNDKSERLGIFFTCFLSCERKL